MTDSKPTSLPKKRVTTIRRLLAAGFVVAAGTAFFKYDVNDRINNMINQVKSFGSYASTTVGQKTYDTFHSDPAELFPDFKKSLDNYATDVRAGTYDTVLWQYQTALEAVQTPEAKSRNWQQQTRDYLDGVKGKVDQDRLDVMVDEAETALVSYRSDAAQRMHMVTDAFKAVEYLNPQGLQTLRSNVDAVLDPATVYVLNVQGVVTSPKENRMAAMKTAFSTLNGDDQAEVLELLVSSASQPDKVAARLHTLYGLQGQPEYQQSQQSPFSGSGMPGETSGNSPGYLQSLKQRVTETFNDMF